MSRRSPRGVYQAGSSSQPTGQPGQARPGRPSGLLTNQPTKQQRNQPRLRLVVPGPQLINCPARPAVCICAYAFHSLIIGSKLPGSTRLLMCAFSSRVCVAVVVLLLIVVCRMYGGMQPRAYVSRNRNPKITGRTCCSLAFCLFV